MRSKQTVLGTQVAAISVCKSLKIVQSLFSVIVFVCLEPKISVAPLPVHWYQVLGESATKQPDFGRGGSRDFIFRVDRSSSGITRRGEAISRVRHCSRALS